MNRTIHNRYIDPLDAIWISTAERVGFQITRSPAAYASFDGKSIITIGSAETLDADDCLAQMILHEMCHALVQGSRATLEDWGLSNVDDRDVFREHACLRLQAALTDTHGLRAVLAPTTDFRSYYDNLADNPLADGQSTDKAVALAKEGWTRALDPPWEPHLRRALTATRVIFEQAALLAPSASEESFLWQNVTQEPPD